MLVIKKCILLSKRRKKQWQYVPISYKSNDNPIYVLRFESGLYKGI